MKTRGGLLTSYDLPTTVGPGPGLGYDIAVTVFIDAATATAVEIGFDAAPITET